MYNFRNCVAWAIRSLRSATVDVSAANASGVNFAF